MRRMRRRVSVLLTSALLAAPLALAEQPAAHAAGTVTSATVDPAAEYAQPFDGIGAISGGGGNSRLLHDYPDPQRSDILDYLFKPGYGANLQILKIEIGGDTNSTDGAEHSFEHTKGVVNCDAGYEMWLAAQAKSRNPNLKVVALSWGAPAWVGEGGSSFFTSSAIGYLTDWLGCAKAKGLPVDYLGGWNERYDGYAGDYSLSAMPWYERLKSAVSAVSPATKVVAADDTWGVATDMRKNAPFAAAVDVVGVHYPCGYLSAESSCPSNADALATGKPLWASENGSQDLDTGALPMARANNRVFLDAKVTASINWPVVAGAYPGLRFATDGLVHADQPWSGAYHVGQSAWVTAQTTQFTQPGWLIDDNSTGTGSGYLGGSRSNGSYVSYLAPDRSAWSTVVETVDASADQTLNLSAAAGLPSGAVHVWTTDLSDPRVVSPMTYVGDVASVGGVYSIPLKAGHMYTVTTVTPAHAPSTAAGPVRAPLALPYTDSLGTAPTGSEPALFSDMNGAFESAPCTGGRTGNCLAQVATGVPVCWACSSYSNPYTLAGDRSWSNYTVASDVLLRQAGQVDVIGRAQSQSTNNNGLAAYHLYVADTGAWSIQRSDLSWGFTTLASGTGPKLSTNHWHRVSLSLQGSTLTAMVDRTTVGSATDDTYGSGPAGLGTGGPADSLHGYYGAQFSNFSVTAGTATSWSGTYQLVNRHSGQLLDASGGSTADGTPLIQWPANGGANQQWRIAPAAGGGYTITGSGSGKSLDIPLASPTAGTQADLATATQQWSIVPDGAGYTTIENRSSGYLLDVSGASTSQGAAVVQWPANDGDNQQWQLVKTGP